MDMLATCPENTANLAYFLKMYSMTTVGDSLRGTSLLRISFPLISISSWARSLFYDSIFHRGMDAKRRMGGNGIGILEVDWL